MTSEMSTSHRIWYFLSLTLTDTYMHRHTHTHTPTQTCFPDENINGLEGFTFDFLLSANWQVGLQHRLASRKQLCFSHMLTLSLFFILSMSLSLSFILSMSLSLSLNISFYVSFSSSLPPFQISIPQSLFMYKLVVSLSLSLSLSLSPSLSLSLSLSKISSRLSTGFSTILATKKKVRFPGDSKNSRSDLHIDTHNTFLFTHAHTRTRAHAQMHTLSLSICVCVGVCVCLFLCVPNTIDLLTNLILFLQLSIRWEQS